jgi:hypothetical protein
LQGLENSAGEYVRTRSHRLALAARRKNDCHEIFNQPSLRQPGNRSPQADQIANSVEAVQDGRIHIELLNGPMLFELKATPAEYSAGLKLAIERGWR